MNPNSPQKRMAFVRSAKEPDSVQEETEAIPVEEPAVQETPAEEVIETAEEAPEVSDTAEEE